MIGFRRHLYTVRDPCTNINCPYCSGSSFNTTFHYDGCPYKTRNYLYKELEIETLDKQELNKIKAKERLKLSSKTRKSSRWA